jgi:hypothetical protein
MSAKWRKGNECWVIRQCGSYPTASRGTVTSSVHADTLRVRWGVGVNAVTNTFHDTDAFHSEEEACRELVRRLKMEARLWEDRITDIRYEQGPMEVSK